MQNHVDGIDIRMIDDFNVNVMDEVKKQVRERRRYMDYSMQIRIEMIRNGIKQYELARKLEISESYLSRLLRNGLSEERYQTILEAIQRDD